MTVSTCPPPRAEPLPPAMRRLRRLTDSAGGALLGALPYALWAGFVNAPAGTAMALRAGLTHALVSATLTYVDAANMRYCFALGRTPVQRIAYAFGGGLALTYAVLITAHWLIGTPHIALTLAAGVIPNLLYGGGYALLLARTSAVASPRS